MLVNWHDGVEMCEGGYAHRQVPGGDWDDQTWASCDGRVVQRTYDPLCDLWVWSKARQIHSDADDALSVDVFAGSLRKRTRLARVIALAWVHCTTPGAHAVAAGTVDANSVLWQNAGTLPHLEHTNAIWEERIESPSEHWAYMCYKWIDSNGDEVNRMVDGELYMVHPSGLVHSLISDQVTAGHMTPDGHRWVAVHGSGLIRMDMAVGFTFGSVLLPPVRMRPSASATLGAIRDRQNASDICRAHSISASTLWTRLCLLARSAPWEDAKLLWALCPIEVMEQLREGTASEDAGVRVLLDTLKKNVGGRCALACVPDADAYGMLKVGWALVRRERLQRRCARQLPYTPPRDRVCTN